MHDQSRRALLIPANEVCLYRAHTLGILRRYFRMSIELGRLPSLVGREFFRASVSSYRAASFEDLVIFVTDVEHSLEQLDEPAQRAIARVVFQEYTFDEAARNLDWPRRSLIRRYFSALDELSLVFLARHILQLFLCHEDCQVPERGKKPASACIESKKSPARFGTNAPPDLIS